MHRHPIQSLGRLAALAGVLLIAWCFARPAPPSNTRQLALPDGRRLPVYRYEKHTKYSADLLDTSRVERYLWLSYESGASDSSERRTDAAAAAGLICHVADSLGLSRVLIQPSTRRFFGLTTVSFSYWFTVHDGNCTPTS